MNFGRRPITDDVTKVKIILINNRSEGTFFVSPSGFAVRWNGKPFFWWITLCRKTQRKVGNSCSFRGKGKLIKRRVLIYSLLRIIRSSIKRFQKRSKNECNIKNNTILRIIRSGEKKRSFFPASKIRYKFWIGNPFPNIFSITYVLSYQLYNKNRMK